ncbi:Ku protein (plasmid) [Actinacidiphila glaucinigra]|uniref:non-homologous end joining protein Ku n=1 Tax=Actinacidiphila glaucinigra TaxID=235986 RepID=UPI002DDC3CA7|nr:Ku protein [Actinacidiphila glaucinigra]WSD65789.1 Ku protein [Actinacidiphila glaucinigra]
MSPAISRLAITFGLVSIPVTVHSVIEEQGVSLHQVHAEDGGRIKLRRRCEVCGREVPFQQVARGYTDPHGRTVVLTEDDLADLPLPSIKAVDVVAFVDAASVDPLQLSRSYFLGFDTSAAKPYVLLRDAMREAGRVAITKVTMRTGSKEQLALLRVRDDLLVLQTMNWADEVRSAEGLAPAADVTVRPQEVQMAMGLMDALSADFDLAVLRDRYRDAMTELVTAKLEGEPLPKTAGVAPAPGDVVDLMAALQASIEAHRHEPAEEEGRPEK